MNCYYCGVGIDGGVLCKDCKASICPIFKVEKTGLPYPHDFKTACCKCGFESAFTLCDPMGWNDCVEYLEHLSYLEDEWDANWLLYLNKHKSQEFTDIYNIIKTKFIDLVSNLSANEKERKVLESLLKGEKDLDTIIRSGYTVYLFQLLIKDLIKYNNTSNTKILSLETVDLFNSIIDMIKLFNIEVFRSLSKKVNI